MKCPLFSDVMDIGIEFLNKNGSDFDEIMSEDHPRDSEILGDTGVS